MARKPDGEPLGHNWIDRFKARHFECLQSFWASSFDSQRAAGLNPAAVDAYFDTVSQIYEEEDLPDHCHYGCDETGLWANIGASVHVIGSRTARQQLLQQSGDRKNTTIMATICADGTSLPPFVIFKGEHLQTATGWIDAELFFEWRKWFDAQTASKAGGKKRVLHLDGQVWYGGLSGL